jgi:GNAT superfamily N-acetyltransferase
MTRRVARLTLDTLADLPESVRTCLFWELDPVRRQRVVEAGAAESEKEAWLSRVLLEWGSCGRVVYVDDEAAAFVVYAPPGYFPGSASLATAPVSDDAVQLATAEVFEDHRGTGLGRVLMQVMVKDLLNRGGVRAVECFGTTAADAEACLLPVAFLQRVGFKTHRPHRRQPRMRLETKSVLTWREEMESALGKLLGAVRPGRGRTPLPTPLHTEGPPKASPAP